MNTRLISTALLSTLGIGATAGAAEYLQSTTHRASFLSPLRLQLVLPKDDPREPDFCRAVRCPPMLAYGAGAVGGLPILDPAFTANLPNVRVSFVIDHVFHEAIAGGGVELDGAEYETHGAAANDENGGPYVVWVPPAGESTGGSMLIYDALVIGACNAFTAFPVTHVTTVGNNGDPVALFEGTDNHTLDSTGFYNLSYTVEAQDGERVSHVHFSGKASVICTAANAL
jgi:hypothetical protein